MQMDEITLRNPKIYEFTEQVEEEGEGGGKAGKGL